MKLKRAGIAAWLVFAGSACAQSSGNVAAAADTIRIAAAPNAASPSGGEVLREIEDPANRDRWLLIRDQNHPEGPGRLVLEPGRSGTSKSAQSEPASVKERPVIHTGDALIVEEHSAVVDTCLEATALGPAKRGEYLKARLEIGGRVVRVMAVSPGHAAFAPESEVGQ
jgi:hypothetical protein